MNADIIFDIERLLKEIELTLSGKVIDENGVERHYDEKARYLNEEGVMKVMTVVRAHVNKNVYLSEIDQLFINRKCAQIYANLYTLLAMNMDKYGVRSLTDINLITEIVDTAIYTALMRAKNGAEAKRFYKSITQNVHISANQERGGISV